MEVWGLSTILLVMGPHNRTSILTATLWKLTDWLLWCMCPVSNFHGNEWCTMSEHPLLKGQVIHLSSYTGLHNGMKVVKLLHAMKTWKIYTVIGSWICLRVYANSSNTMVMIICVWAPSDSDAPHLSSSRCCPKLAHWVQRLDPGSCGGDRCL